MNKKILSGLWLFLLVFVLSGCTDTKYSFEINGRDNITILQTTTVDLNKLNEINPEFDFEKNRLIKKYQDSFKKKGYAVKEIDNNNQKGCTLYKSGKMKFFKAENLPDGFMLPQESDTPFQIQKGPFRTKYYIHLVFDPGKIEGMPRQASLGRAKVRKVASPKVSMAAKLPHEEGVKPRKHKEDFHEHEDIEENSNIEDPESIESPAEDLSADNENAKEEQQQEKTADEPRIYISPNDTFATMTLDKISNELKPTFELSIKIPKRASENNATKIVSSREYKWELPIDRTQEIILKYERWNVFSILFIILLIYGTSIFFSKNSQYIANKEDIDNKNAF